jgi:DNA-binding MarR family transcriptional regulator
MMTSVTAAGPPDPHPAASPPDVAPDPGGDPRDAVMHDLAALTLPLMWTLRQASVRALEPLGLRPIQGLVLGIIDQGVDSPKQIADLLDLSPPMLSGLLGDLEERGLIVRSPHPDDRRRVRLAPSERGRAATERITRLWTDVMRERLGHLSDGDLTVLLRIYRSFVGAP